MKTEKSIFFAFVLNLSFSIFEFIGGIFTGSIAILSDAVHDIGDATSIGAAFFLEKKSKKQPDKKYTFGYARFSVVGGLITNLILLCGSAIVICGAFMRIISPTEINYNGMIVFAVVGVCVNLFAALLTRDKGSLNQKAVNLHMLEDVLGWIVVLIGAVVMKFTDIRVVDPLISIGVSVFVFANAIRNLKEILEVFLEKTPSEVSIDKLEQKLCEIDGVIAIHHVHVWSMDGSHNYATMHVVANGDTRCIKDSIRKELHQYGICHATLELESQDEPCNSKHCHVDFSAASGHRHHHHHH